MCLWYFVDIYNSRKIRLQFSSFFDLYPCEGLIWDRIGFSISKKELFTSLAVVEILLSLSIVCRDIYFPPCLI